MSNIGTITIDLGKKCAECGKGGACGNGICLRCSTNAMDMKRRMKSKQGQAAQLFWQRKLETLRKG